MVFLDGQIKEGYVFSHLVGNKMAHAYGGKCSSEWSTKITKRSGWTCYKGRGGYHGLCPVAFLNGVYEPIDLDNEILLVTLQIESLLQISERCRLTWHEHDQ